MDLYRFAWRLSILYLMMMASRRACGFQRDRRRINNLFRLAYHNRIFSFAQSLAENSVFFARLFRVVFCRGMSKNLACESDSAGAVQYWVLGARVKVYFCAHIHAYFVTWKYSVFHQGIFAGYYARKDAFSCAVFGHREATVPITTILVLSFVS